MGRKKTARKQKKANKSIPEHILNRIANLEKENAKLKEQLNNNVSSDTNENWKEAAKLYEESNKKLKEELKQKDELITELNKTLAKKAKDFLRDIYGKRFEELYDKIEDLKNLIKIIDANQIQQWLNSLNETLVSSGSYTDIIKQAYDIVDGYIKSVVVDTDEEGNNIYVSNFWNGAFDLKELLESGLNKSDEVTEKPDWVSELRSILVTLHDLKIKSIELDERTDKELEELGLSTDELDKEFDSALDEITSDDSVEEEAKEASTLK